MYEYIYTPDMYITYLTINVSIFFRGDSTSVQAGNLVTTLWLNNCVVRVMSTNSQPKDSSQVLRQQHNGSRVSVQCPTAVAQYNKFIGGVDRNDQLRQYYNVGRKGRKYYRYIFWFYLRLVLVIHLSCIVSMATSRGKIQLPSHSSTIVCSSTISWLETTTVANDLAVAKQLDRP